MTKSIRACIDLSRLLDLASETAESDGRMTFPISGNISFDNVEFSYPQRPDIPILKGMTFDVKPGECVGIVGCVTFAFVRRSRSDLCGFLQRVGIGEIDGRLPPSTTLRA